MRTPTGRKIAKVSLPLLLLAALVAAALGYGVLQMGGGYAAKVAGSWVFLSGRTPESVMAQELSWMPVPVYLSVDAEAQTLTARGLGLAPRTVIYRPGLGCTLLPLDGSLPHAPAQLPPAWTPGTRDPRPWPLGDAPPESPAPEVAYAALEALLDEGFAEDTDPLLAPKQTRAIVVLYDGHIVAERYAEGYNQDSRLPGWSMTKSVTSALIGRLVHAGKLDIFRPAAVPEWREPNDPRNAITVDMLLRMSSGLAFNESYFNPFSTVSQMLFIARDAGAYAAAQPLAYPVDTHWAYSSGTSNILSRLVRHTVGEDRYARFPHEALFAPLGMHSATIEPDPSGTYVGSSFLFATARDWARFGLLHAQDGVWQGERLLPEGWVNYLYTPTPDAPERMYGAHWWRPADVERIALAIAGTPLPEDTFSATGFEAQQVTVVPSRKVVIVRLGLSQDESRWPRWGFVAKVLSVLPRR